MAQRFLKLTRPNIRKLESGQRITENGIVFERLTNGDGRYTVNIMVDGQRIHRVIGRESEGVTRTQAEDFIQNARTNARTGRLQLPKGRKVALGFREASGKYIKKLAAENGKDLRMKEARLQHHLVPYFKNKPLTKLTTFDVERYKKTRLDEGAAPGTINRELTVISHLFNKAIEWGWINYRPAVIKRLQEGDGRIVYLTTDQAARLLNAAKFHPDPNLYKFILIGLETSMRKMEILSIRLEDIDVVRRIIYVPRAKSGPREQPITGHLAEYLAWCLETASLDQSWLFPSARSKSGHVVNIEKSFSTVVKLAGMDPKDIVRHTLRHTAITHLVQAGVDLPTVKRVSGHKTLRMVERYSHQNGQHIRAAMDKLEDRYKDEAG